MIVAHSERALARNPQNHCNPGDLGVVMVKAPHAWPVPNPSVQTSWALQEGSLRRKPPLPAPVNHPIAASAPPSLPALP